jgi:outer membrane protein assembly factor BamB
MKKEKTKMEIMKNKSKISALTFVLMLTISATFVALTDVNAQEEPRQSYCYLGVTPNPVGVGQDVLFHISTSQQLSRTHMGWEGLSITIKRPDGETETISDIRTDATGGTGRMYVPSMIGTYKVQGHFPEQVTTEDNTNYDIGIGTTMLASDSEIVDLVVQEEQLEFWPGVPLPTEYWTRPVDAQLREWSAITGNWLATYIPSMNAIYNKYAPETPHILWTRELAMGGLVGGELGNQGMECGDAYEGKLADSIILQGTLYYNQFESRGGSNVEQNVVAVDLHTGEELWCRPLLDPDGVSQRLLFGQNFYWDSYNYHGVFAYLWATADRGATWHAYDAQTGRWIYSMENVPPGTNIYGTKGEIYRYTVNLEKGWMTLWNSSRVVSDEGSWRATGNIYNCTWESARHGGYEWNVTIPTGLTGECRRYLDDRIIGSNTTSWTPRDMTGDPIRIWSISIEPGHEGELLLDTIWEPPTGGLRIGFADASLEDNVFILAVQDTMKFYGFSLDSGKLLWETEPQHYMDLYQITYGDFAPDDQWAIGLTTIAYGRLFSSMMSGIVYCYNVTTGEPLWTYEANDPYSEILWSNNWPLHGLFFADGKFYVGHCEHSPMDPKARGAPFFAIDIETGDEVFRVNGLFRQTLWGGRAKIGDSIIATMDTYDQRIYSIGKGPSAVTVSAPDIAIPLGTSVMIRGMVTDESPGTKEYSLTARFPNGVPAIADEDMGDWMKYVYKQFPMPQDAKGVEVKLEILDPNNKFYEIGRVTSDASGMFKKMWAPEIEGEYTIIATFEGSDSYYCSYAETALGVDPAPTPAQPIEPEPAEPAEAPFITTEIAIMIAAVLVAVAVIVGFWFIRKRK